MDFNALNKKKEKEYSAPIQIKLQQSIDRELTSVSRIDKNNYGFYYGCQNGRLTFFDLPLYLSSSTYLSLFLAFVSYLVVFPFLFSVHIW